MSKLCPNPWLPNNFPSSWGSSKEPGEKAGGNSRRRDWLCSGPLDNTGCELHRYTSTWIFFFSKFLYCFDPQLGACVCGGPTVRTGVRHLYRALEHPRISVPTGGPGMIALQTPRDNTVFGESKVTCRLSIVRGVGNPTPALRVNCM